ncbi:MAG: hypothetical protein B7Y95_17560 [Rhizobiales bacterium 32-66-11]|nr:MAG: hypothetical protein B7Y95_17560 [Rhizobiales bacterium 32-66-11]
MSKPWTRRACREASRSGQAANDAVRIVAVEPVGAYAVRLGFDDGHGTGLYTWPLLRTLGLEQETRFAAYLEALDAQGLSRG